MKNFNAKKITIENIIFYKLTGPQTGIVQSLMQVKNSLGGREKWIITDCEEDIKAFASAHTIMVSDESSRAKLGSMMYQVGISRYLSFDDFVSFFPDIYKLSVSNQSGKVVLAFLTESYTALLSGIFSDYGYETIVVNSSEQLQQALKQNIAYLVIDQDMPNWDTNKRIRENIFKMLLDQRVRDPHFAVSVIKDFSVGSLYDDVLSSIKKVANLMLSPEEYLVFLTRFLRQYGVEKLKIRFRNLPQPADIHETIAGTKKTMKKSMSLFLRNGKRIYNHIASEEHPDLLKYQQTYINEYHNLDRRASLFEWLEDFLDHGEEKNNRASFSFVKGNASSPELVSSANVKSEPLKKRMVVPQVTPVTALPH